MRRVFLACVFAAAVECDFGVDLSGLTGGDAMTDVGTDGGTDAAPPASPITHVALGSAHSCALHVNGTVSCWGAGANGRLGTGNALDSVTPARVAALTDAQLLGVGGGHTCAIGAVSGLTCWGANSYGQLGDGTTNDHNQPFQVTLPTGSGTPIAVTGAKSSTCALFKNGQVDCWGYDLDGELGDGTMTLQRNMPAAIKFGSTGSVAFTSLQGAATGGHFCGLTAAGAMYCWGLNASGQLGDGTTTNQPYPVAVQGLPAGPVTAMALGASHSCAIVGGSVYCWGLNMYGQLGNGNVLPSGTPGKVTLAGTATALSAGTGFTCALTSMGVACWGLNNGGQLGDGTLTTRSVAMPVAGATITEIASGSMHTCGPTAEGNVQCWGFNSNGRLGYGGPISSGVAARVMNVSNATALAVSADHVCAQVGAQLLCWGDNGYGQIGWSSVTQAATSIPVPADGGGNFTNLTGGGVNTCGVVDGSAYCFGDGVNGALGTGGSNSAYAPVPFGTTTGVTQVAVGGQFVCVLGAGGTVACSGLNATGQLGNNSTSTSLSPVAVVGVDGGAIAGVKLLGAGNAHACGATSNGVVCWGSNASGELGTGVAGGMSTVATRALVYDGGVPTGFALGNAHTCVLEADNTVACWGAGTDGQLGDDMSINETTPTAPQLTKATAIAAGSNHTCAILKSTNNVVCWGYGVLGETGDGAQSSAKPLMVAGVDAGVALGAAGDVTCALRADGTVWCWGYDPDGQLGSDTLVIQSTPTLVVGL